jgi:transposase
VRDDRPFAGHAPPAAICFYSPDRSGSYPQAHLKGWAGLMQADAYAGFNRLYEPKRQPGPIIEAACWAHARRKFFDLARLTKAPIALEVVARIDALFAIERDLNGLSPDERKRIRQERSRPLAEALGNWLREQYAKLSPNSQVAKAIAYSLNSGTPCCASSMTAASVSPTTPPSGPFGALPSGAATGPSPAPTRAAGAPRPSTL